MSENITNNPSVPSQVVAEVKFPQWVNNLGIIPTSYKDSMSYYECLAWLCKFLEETVIPTVNQNGQATEELQALYVQLNSYVSNYFENLDVQEEINNKLDDMVEAGTLQEIIGEYLNANAIWGFDTVSDMISSFNLINGSYAKTLGYYEKNDGGGATYKIRTITNDDNVDNMFIIEMEDETLIAELIIENNTVNINQLGGKGDETTDNHNIILGALNYIYEHTSESSTVNNIDSNYILEFNKGIYLNDSLISFNEYIDNLIIKGNGAYITSNGFKFGTKIGYNVVIDELNFYNVNKCYEFDYIDKNYQTLLFKNSTFRDCENIFIINRRSCMTKFENCKFIGMSKAMLLNNVDKVEISNCWFQTSNETVSDYFSVIEQTGNDEGFINVHDSFFIPQLQGNYISWFKINKKITFHENRASGESPNQLALIYTSSDMDTSDASNQQYVISIYNNPILDCKHLLILNGVPNMLNISNNAGYKVVSNKLIIWDPALSSSDQETKLNAKLSNFRITLHGNNFRQFDYLTGDINLPSAVKPIIPENLLNYIQRSYRSIDNQIQTKVISKTMSGTNLTELKFQIFDLSSYTKRNNSGSMWLLCYKGYTSGNASAETMIDVISLKQDNSGSVFKLEKQSIVGSRTNDYNVTFDDNTTSVDTTTTPNPIIKIVPASNRFISYPQFSRIELADMLTLGQL